MFLLLADQVHLHSNMGIFKFDIFSYIAEEMKKFTFQSEDIQI